MLIRPESGFHRNVVIAREPAGGHDLQDLRATYRDGLAGAGATGLTDTKPLTLDGDEAFTYEYSAATAMDRLRGRQVRVVHAEFVYTITLTEDRAGFAAADSELTSMLRSWRWR